MLFKCLNLGVASTGVKFRVKHPTDESKSVFQKHQPWQDAFAVAGHIRLRMLHHFPAHFSGHFVGDTDGGGR